MKSFSSGQLAANISRATVTFGDTGENFILKTSPGSTCHFFEKFAVGSDDIQLRLDWSDLDRNGNPTLDADFIDKKSGKHRCLKGKRKTSHHTASSLDKGRCYKWNFEDFNRQFSVKVEWCASVSVGFKMKDFASAEVH